MLINKLKSVLLQKLDHEPSGSQKELLTLLSNFLVLHRNNQLFIIKGYAGTGKTTTISALIKTMSVFRMKNVLLAPTGRAAKVLSFYAQKPAYTIHKKIYRQQSSSDGFGEFKLDQNLHTDTYFIIDECSMIGNKSGNNSIFGSGNLLEDLIEYVYQGRNCKLIFVGDTAQLPPVGLETSPALNPEYIRRFGLDVLTYTLTDVVRQAENSGILTDSTKIRIQIAQKKEIHSFIIMDLFDDVIRMYGNYLVEQISDCYDKYGTEQTKIICRTNKRANKYNMGIRQQILWREEEITVGDHVMVVKNNYYWVQDYEELDFIANGDIAVIEQIMGYQERYGYRFADVVLRMLDYDNVEIETKIMIDTFHLESSSLPSDKNREFYYAVAEDYSEIKNKRKRLKAIRENPFFNALQVKFAYAITCHKAQGGQWKAVFIDHGYLTDDMISREFYRWLYTAFTRATEKVYLVNFRKEFFSEED
jgi:exodeoxyribonuclease V